MFYIFVKQNSSQNAVYTVKELAKFFVKHGCGALFLIVLKLFKIFLSMPVTSATAERSFSALKRP